MSISIEKAIIIAQEYINNNLNDSHSSGDDIFIIERDFITEKEEYWEMHYQSKKYLETGSISFALAGNLPIKISKFGKVLGF